MRCGTLSKAFHGANRTRWVPLSAQALAAIKEQRADSMLKSSWVFCDDEGQPITRAVFERQLILACHGR